MKIKKILMIIVGCLCLALGSFGVVIPILPTTPFLLVTVFCFAGSSERLDKWFRNTSLYKKHLESFVQKRGMSVVTKVWIIICVTLLMGLGFYLMAKKSIWVPCVILAAVWLAHVFYFCFGVKTIKAINNNVASSID